MIKISPNHAQPVTTKCIEALNEAAVKPKKHRKSRNLKKLFEIEDSAAIRSRRKAKE